MRQKDKNNKIVTCDLNTTLLLVLALLVAGSYLGGEITAEEGFSAGQNAEIIGEGTRTARLQVDFSEADLSLEQLDGRYAQVIEEAASNFMSPGEQAYNLGKDVIDTWFDFSGAILEFEGVAYSSEYLSNLSNAFSNVGLALSMAQLAVDYSRGDDTAMAVTAFNTAQGLSIGRWGTKALKISMLGVLAIEYPLDALIDQMIDGRTDMWTEAYNLYYSDHGRDSEEWYDVLREIEEESETADDFDYLLNQEIDEYVNRFWEDDTGALYDYQSEAQDHGFTGKGYYSEDLIEEINKQKRSKLLTENLRPVFDQLEKDLKEEQKEEYREELARVKEEFNRRLTISIEEYVGEGEPNYSGYWVKLGPLNDRAVREQWIGFLDEDGRTHTEFTLLGHQLVGRPNEMRLYETEEDLEQDNPVLVEEFVVDAPHTRVEFGQDFSLDGTWNINIDGRVETIEEDSTNVEHFNESIEVIFSTQGDKIELIERENGESRNMFSLTVDEGSRKVMESIEENRQTLMEVNLTSEDDFVGSLDEIQKLEVFDEITTIIFEYQLQGERISR